MKQDNDIFSRLPRHDGTTVPEDYFADFAKRMAEQLPVRDELEQPAQILQVPKTMWQRVRPYVYMAAMFGGVWCMLKMFSTMQTQQDPTRIESYPELAEALDDEQFVREYVVEDLTPTEIIDQLDSVALSEIDFSALPMPDSVHQLPGSNH